VKIGITTDTKGLKKGTKKAKGMLGSLGKFAGPAAIGIAGVTAAMAGLGIAAGIAGKAVRKALDRFETLDQLGKFSDEIGVTVDQLRGMQLGARLTGTKIEVLEKGLQRLVRRLGEAKLGYGSGIAGLKALGLEAEHLTQLNTFEAMKKVAQGIRELPGPFEKAAVAASLFGQKQGAKLLTFLEAGGEGIDEFVAKMVQLGGSMSRIDVANVEAANDSMELIRTTLRSFHDQLAIQLAPVLLAISEKILELGEDGLDMGAMVAEGFGWAIKATGLLADSVAVVTIGFQHQQGAIVEDMAMATEATAWFARGVQELVNLIPGVETEFADDMTVIAESLRDSSDQMRSDLKEKVENLLDETNTQKLERLLDEIRNRTAEIAKDMTEIDHSLEDFADRNKPAIDLLAKLKDEIRFFGKEAREVSVIKLMEEGIDPRFIQQLKQAGFHLEQLTTRQEVLDRLKDPLVKMRETVQRYSVALRTGAITLHQYRQAMQDLREGLVGVFDPRGVVEFSRKMQELQAQFAAGLFGREELKLRQLDALPDRIKQIKEDALTPMQKFKKDLEQLKLDANAFHLSPREVQTQITNLRETFQEEVQVKAKQEVELTGTAELGSTQAADLIARNFGASGNVQNRQLTELAQQTRLLNQIATGVFRSDGHGAGLGATATSERLRGGIAAGTTGGSRRLEETAQAQLTAANEHTIILRRIAENRLGVI
jgi:hypothetical protein